MNFFKKIRKAFRDFINEVLHEVKDSRNKYSGYQSPGDRD